MIVRIPQRNAAAKITAGEAYSNVLRVIVLKRSLTDLRSPDSHRHLHALFLREALRLVIPRIHVPRHADSRIVGQHALDALCHRVSSVGDGDLPGVQRVANAHAAAVVDRHPDLRRWRC